MQNREPPAFQEYASELLANHRFRLMTLAERGLCHTMRLECWVNRKIPSNAGELAKILGFDAGEVGAALSERVKSFFVEDKGFFTCTELVDYRQHLDERKAKQSEGGKKGSALTNEKRKHSDATTSPATLSSNSPDARRGEVESLVQQSTAQQSPTQSIQTGVTVTDTWLADYEQNEYVMAKNGG
jgi:hypothetical protein